MNEHEYPLGDQKDYIAFWLTLIIVAYYQVVVNIFNMEWGTLYWSILCIWFVFCLLCLFGFFKIICDEDGYLSLRFAPVSIEIATLVAILIGGALLLHRGFIWFNKYEGEYEEEPSEPDEIE